jgi:long-chain acyl-CoA synthetase
MERIWLKQYPAGVPADIDPSRWPSLVAMMEESFARFGGEDAFIGMGKTITYAELDDLSRGFAAWLQNKGLKPGTRIALMMPNVLQYPVAIAGALRAGLTVVNVNPLYTSRELEFQLKDSGAETIVVLENFAATVQHALPHSSVKHVVVARMGDMLGTLKGTLVNLVVRHVKKMVPAYDLQATAFNDAIDAGRGMDLQKPEIAPEDIAFIQYTGGTTGVPKGAVLTHRNMIANTLQVEAWQQPMLAREPQVKQLRIVAALPLYHIFALTVCYLAAIRMGSVSLLIPNPRDLPSLIKELRGFKVNSFPGVNTLYNALLHHPDFGQVDWSMLKCSIGGGMPVQQSVAERWLKATGCPLIEGYGLSETAPVLTCTPGDSNVWTGSIGLPISSTEIAIRDNDDRDLPLGQPGEICARGPQVMPGYWQRPDETAKVMSADGFFRTGDIGVMDDNGQVTIVDRKKDMILVSGFKVYPNEVEAVVASHPGVLECAVIGLPDERMGESVNLFVVKKDPHLTAEELRKFCASQLTHYKIPRRIEFRSELPKSNVGKILRRALRDEVLRHKTEAA